MLSINFFYKLLIEYQNNYLSILNLPVELHQMLLVQLLL